MSYILCDKCSSIRAEYFCDDCEQGYYKHRADHVSKSELRAWCEERKKERWLKINPDDTICYEKIGHDYALSEILEKFCKGEL